jgi:hypothetical protein
VLSDDFWSHLAVTSSGCWEWQRGRHRRGYGGLKVANRHVKAHRYAWELTHGPIPCGMFVCHSCDNPPCCNPSHLFLGTPKDNQDDMRAKGRQAVVRGSSHRWAKLTEEQVSSIRSRYRSGEMGKDLASEFGVSRGLISLIVNNKVWVP